MNAIWHYRTLCTVRLFILFLNKVHPLLFFTFLELPELSHNFHGSPLSIIISHFCSNFEPLFGRKCSRSAMGHCSSIQTETPSWQFGGRTQLFDCNGFIGARKCCLLLAFKDLPEPADCTYCSLTLFAERPK